MLLNTLSLHLPTTALEAAKLYKELEDVKVLAGGTFILNSLKLMKVKGNNTAKNVISLSKVTDLKNIKLSGDDLTIGAMVTITDLVESPLLTDNFSILNTICRNISTTPIRNMASVGGNLTCRYTWTELPVAMIALDASMHFLTPDGKEVIQPAQAFFNNNARSEFLFTHVTIKKNPHATLVYRRVRKMSEVDQPLLSVCVKADINAGVLTNTRIVINSGTAFAKRDELAENFLNNKKVSADLGQHTMEHLTTAIYDTRSTEYKQYMFRTCIRQGIEEICKG